MNTTNPINTNRSGEPLLASVASWAVLAASFGLSATTWIALAQLAGFTGTLTLPDVGITLAMAWLMPIAVDGYVVVALVLWMAPVPQKVARFARLNTYGAAGVGIAAQSAYHLLSTLSVTDETWRVVLAGVVGALPPTFAGLAVHMRALIRRESNSANTSVVAAQSAAHVTSSASASVVGHAAPSPATTHSDNPGHAAPVTVPTHLLPTARFAVTNHQQTHGRPISPQELSDRMNITPAMAGHVLATLAERQPVAVAPVLNGTAVIGGDTR